MTTKDINRSVWECVKPFCEPWKNHMDVGFQPLPDSLRWRCIGVEFIVPSPCNDHLLSQLCDMLELLHVLWCIDPQQWYELITHLISDRMLPFPSQLWLHDKEIVTSIHFIFDRFNTPNPIDTCQYLFTHHILSSQAIAAKKLLFKEYKLDSTHQFPVVPIVLQYSLQHRRIMRQQIKNVERTFIEIADSVETLLRTELYNQEQCHETSPSFENCVPLNVCSLDLSQSPMGYYLFLENFK